MFSRKGVSLPINMLVILSVAVIVLLAVVAFFMGGMETGAVDDQAAISACCSPVSSFQLCDLGTWEDVRDEGYLDECSQDIGERYPGYRQGDPCASVGRSEVPCGHYVPGGPRNCPGC